MIRCTSRFMLTARSWVWLAQISRRSGLRPSMKAGKRRETSSLLPCCGGMKTISRRHSPAATRSSFLASSAWCQFVGVVRLGVGRERQQVLPGVRPAHASDFGCGVNVGHGSGKRQVGGYSDPIL